MRLSSQKKENFSKAKLRLVALCVLSLGIGIFLESRSFTSGLYAYYNLIASKELWASIFEVNNLKTIHLDISFKNLQKIETKRKKAIITGKLIPNDDDYVEAKIRVENITYGCKVRLKGNFSDHWDGDKHSLRVKIKGGNKVYGMSRFSLQDPRTRYNTNEWIYLQHMTKEGVMTPQYHFVNLKINGKKKGIYALEEFFSTEMIERNKKRVGAIIGFDQSLLRNESRLLNRSTIHKSLEHQIRAKAKGDSENRNSLTVETAKTLLRNLQSGTLAGDKIFKSDQLGKFLALCHLWRAEHNFQTHNINFYYDPIVGQLEPIAFDGAVNISTVAYFDYFSDVMDHSFWIYHVLKSPDVAYNYINSLKKYSNQTYIENLQKNLQHQEIKYRRLLIKDLLFRSPQSILNNFSTLLFANPWEVLENRASRIKNELSDKNLLNIHSFFNSKTKKLDIYLRNNLKMPVEVLSFNIQNNTLQAIDLFSAESNKTSLFLLGKNSIVIPPLKNNTIHDYKFSKIIPSTFNDFTEGILLARVFGDDSAPVKIEFKISNEFDLNLLPFSDSCKNPSLDFDFITQNSPSEFSFTPGSHTINRDIIIPPHSVLTIPPKTSLFFTPESSLISRGAIRAVGNATDPILFSSAKESWGGIMIFNANDKSIFEHCDFENITGIGKAANPEGISRAGWNLTGAITLYKSDSVLNQCTFNNIKTEDNLNIIHSSFSMKNSSFTNAISDAFDGDFVIGEIENCYFYNIAGDGVDFSGSNALIINSQFTNISDKAISVGEASKISVKNCLIDNVSFGVVSKDLSHAEVWGNSSISNAKISAFAAFQKKNEFGPASISIEDTKIHNCFRSYLIQTGSTGVLNNRNLDTSSFKTAEFYDAK